MRRGAGIATLPAGGALLVSSVVLLVAGVLGAWATHQWQDGSRMTSSSYCQSNDISERGCLVRVAGAVEGPFDGGRRSVGLDWTFRPLLSVTVVETASVTSSVSDRLERAADDEVVGVFWDERLVAFEEPGTGRLLTTSRWGTSFASATGWGAGLFLLGSFRALGMARSTRRTTGSWWQTPEVATSAARPQAWWLGATGGASCGLWVGLVSQHTGAAATSAVVVGLLVGVGVQCRRSSGRRSAGRRVAP